MVVEEADAEERVVVEEEEERTDEERTDEDVDVLGSTVPMLSADDVGLGVVALRCGVSGERPVWAIDKREDAD